MQLILTTKLELMDQIITRKKRVISCSYKHSSAIVYSFLVNSMVFTLAVETGC